MFEIMAKRRPTYRDLMALTPAVLLAIGLSAGGPAVTAKSTRTQGAAAQAQDDPGCRGCVSQAASLFASGKNGAAADLLRSWSGRCPRNAQLHLLLSTVLLRLGPTHAAEAQQAAAEAVKIAPNSIAAHLQYALALMTNESFLKATQEFESVVELDPGSYEGWSSLASLYGQLHEDDRAQVCARKAADLEPSSKTVRLRMLKNLEHSGKTVEARAELKRLVTSGGYGPEFLQELAAEAVSIGANEEAITACSKVIEAYPKSAAPLKLMARAQLNSCDYGGCLETTDKLLAMNANNDEAHALKGLALLKRGSLDEADREFQAALGRQPELPLALLGKGELLLLRGNYQAASETVLHSMDADPALEKDSQACYTLAQALEKQGDRDASLQYYKHSLSYGLAGEEAASAKEAVARLESTSQAPTK